MILHSAQARCGWVCLLQTFFPAFNSHSQSFLDWKLSSASLVDMPFFIRSEKSLKETAPAFRRLAEGHLRLGDIHSVDKVAKHTVKEIHRNAFPSTRC